jgi:hypothetical protein
MQRRDLPPGWLRADYTSLSLSLSLSLFRMSANALVMGSISARDWQLQVDAGERARRRTEGRTGGKIFEHTLRMFALVLDIA